MSAKQISISGRDGAFAGYLAAPASGSGAGVVVIQEIFGVNKVMRDIADAYAAHGYFALVPDLFWRLEPGVQLTDKTDAEWKRAFDLMNRFDPDKGVKDIQSTIDTLRGREGCSGKVGAVGYCLGGLLAYLTATRTDVNASVGYYGVNIQQKLDEARNIRNPVMLHIAAKDEYVPPPAQKKIIEGLSGNPLVTIHVYPEMDHAFARAGGAHYDKACADLANGRTATFFRHQLS
ncbi:MAG: dienelactone hydrolase family protein [Alphaproteobacteria bacterium]|nr:dienelactone hydrolase family protein [Alphaproteobacteria bacterium]MBV9694885.1 dienelactone hydrolase family protein [Alphaproteobacteria bacterium]